MQRIAPREHLPRKTVVAVRRTGRNRETAGNDLLETLASKTDKDATFMRMKEEPGTEVKAPKISSSRFWNPTDKDYLFLKLMAHTVVAVIRRELDVQSHAKYNYFTSSGRDSKKAENFYYNEERLLHLAKDAEDEAPGMPASGYAARTESFSRCCCFKAKGNRR